MGRLKSRALEHARPRGIKEDQKNLLTIYHYHDNDIFMQDKKTSKLRELRKSQNPPLTLKELAHRAGVSYTTVWNLENGPEEKVRSDIKYKVARILGASATKLFPSEAVRERRYLFECLFDFCPTLEFKNEVDVENILEKMTLDELWPIYHAGLTPGEAIKRLNRWAKRLGLKAAELKK